MIYTLKLHPIFCIPVFIYVIISDKLESNMHYIYYFFRIRPCQWNPLQGDGISLEGIVANPTTKHLLVQQCLNIVELCWFILIQYKYKWCKRLNGMFLFQ